MAKITIDYCSQFESYNGEPVRDGYVLAPFIITDEMYRYDNSLIKENTRIWRQFGARIRVGFLVVHKDDFDKMIYIFNSGVRAYFNDNPRLNPGRCQIGTADNGLPVLCDKKTSRCSGCIRRNDNLPRYRNREDYVIRHSIQNTCGSDTFAEYEDIPDTSTNPVEELAITNMLISQLADYLDKFNPRYSKIVALSLRNYDVEQIGAELKLKPARVYQELKNARDLVKSFLGI